MIEIGIGFLAVAVVSFVMAFRSRRKEVWLDNAAEHAGEEAGKRYITKINDNVLQIKRG